RPPEELYDMENDPHALVNLASDPTLDSVRNELRSKLYQTLIDQRDTGMIPEPILDEMAFATGSKYAVLQQPENRDLVHLIIQTITAGENGDIATLHATLASPSAALR